MGKRSNFERVERDFYPTPMAAVAPLLPHLAEGTRFYEPCAGDGRLVQHIESAGHQCVSATDIEPLAIGIGRQDIFDTPEMDCLAITNPPWDRKLLHPIIDHLVSNSQGAWLLFDADWMHTKQSAAYMKHCRRVVSVGRVKWIPDSKMTGKDNCAWHFFRRGGRSTCFYGRTI